MGGRPAFIGLLWEDASTSLQSPPVPPPQGGRDDGARAVLLCDSSCGEKFHRTYPRALMRVHDGRTPCRDGCDRSGTRRARSGGAPEKTVTGSPRSGGFEPVGSQLAFTPVMGKVNAGSQSECRTRRKPRAAIRDTLGDPKPKIAARRCRRVALKKKLQDCRLAAPAFRHLTQTLEPDGCEDEGACAFSNTRWLPHSTLGPGSRAGIVAAHLAVPSTRACPE